MSFAVWVSTNAGLYGLLGGLLWLPLIAFSVRMRWWNAPMSAWYNRLIFAGLVVAVFSIDRWPLLFIPTPLNPDEGQMAAQALKAVSDPLPWHGFDGTTSGPLDSYVLTLPRLLGQRITMQTTHTIAALLELGTIFALQAGVATLFGAAVGRCAVLALLPFFAFAQMMDFVHYSSEHLPIFLIACSLCALASTYRKRCPDYVSCAVGGIILALAPFAKLQSLLFVAYIGLTFVMVIVTRPATAAKKRAALLAFFGGGFGTLGIVLALVAAGGSVHDAFVSYLLSSAAYSQTVTSLGLAFFFWPDPSSGMFAVTSTALCCLLGTVAIRLRPNRRHTSIVAFAAGLTLVAVWTIRLPNHPFPHYLSFEFFAVSVLIAALAGTVYRNRHRAFTGGLRGRYAASEPLARTGLFAAVSAIIVVPALIQELAIGSPFPYLAPTYLAYRDRMAAGLRHVIPANSRIAVWGWMPQYYVYTQTIMATKDAHTYWDITPGPYRAYYRARYMQSMQQTQPTYFVDAVASGSFGFTDRKLSGFEIFPELAALITQHYWLIAEINGVRIYKRRTA